MSDLDNNYYIDHTQRDGNMIDLRCKNHPHLSWYTKNISPIGCRKIYSNQYEECDCPCSDLEVIPKPTGETE